MRVKSLAGIAVLLVAGGVFALPAGAGGGGGGDACQSVSAGSTLIMRDFCFEGTAHVISSGQPITVRNDGETGHDITAVNGEFDSARLSPGERVDITLPDHLSVVRFYCSLHGSRDGGGMGGVFAAGNGVASVGFDGSQPPTGSTATSPSQATPPMSAATDAAMIAATEAAKSDATVALVVVVIIGMAVAFGLGIMVWLAGRVVPARRNDD